MTWCFNCQTNQNGDQLSLCKELGHDIDSEGLFQITNYETKGNKTNEANESPVKNLAKLATSEMTKICTSQSDNTRVFAVVKMNNHYETIELDKKNSRTIHWLMVTASDKLNEMYSEDICANVIGFLKAKALMNEEIESREINLRLAFVNDEIYYDFGHTDWKLLKISKDNVCFVDYSENTPLFIRTSKTVKQIEPNLMPDGDPLDEFVKLCRIPNPELFKVHLISMFIAGTPMPIMAIHGHSGASKSTTSSMIKRIVDPSGRQNEDNLKSFPHGEDNFVTSLAGSYFSAYENISHIDLGISNMLCRAITGGSFEKRTQYTNSDVYTISVKRKILINGIDFTISQSDLADRSIIYEMERIPEEHRKTDKSVEETFRKLLPSLLGQIFLILQKAISIKDVVEQECTRLPRMASFGIFGEAIYQALGNNQGEFLNLYNQSLKKNLEILYENNPIIPCLEYVLGDKKEIDIQANDLYKKIKSFVDTEGFNIKRIPQGANALSNWFTKSKALLDENNIKVTKYTNTLSKEISGFSPNATIYSIKRIELVQTTLKNELDV
ncbi:hypothetical protein SCCGRSA3_01042 [Marine Group I thaumarchaeote SCGC RSA3]|uniref:Uncharacterized protein n=2 Tax=Marine Group I TaxID=905826 RepID=A0A087RT52_9ARCH|nr:hypothetical protein AAA799D11_00599 [Marine Group I thaumarchaeote SCGC AAA799-D11]KFM18709.1 hypothetical protein SCCGRSA3_01042 [Marine Group I thaumarchaeote SCGC RSA3]